MVVLVSNALHCFHKARDLAEGSSLLSQELRAVSLGPLGAIVSVTPWLTEYNCCFFYAKKFLFISRS